MSLTVPNDCRVMHIANVTCAVCRGKQDLSMLQFTSCSYPILLPLKTKLI